LVAMSSEVRCPSCGKLITSDGQKSPPPHCPGCGGRLACPRCGGALSKHPNLPSAFRCSRCEFDLAGLETAALDPMADLYPNPTEGGFDIAVPVPGFDVLAELGKGGMGTVLKAWERSLERFVALKVLHPALAVNRDMIVRFRREAILGAGLRHPHLMQVHEIHESQGTPVIVMPLINGRDLGRIVQDRRRHKDHKNGQSQNDTAHPWASLSNRGYLLHAMPVLDQLIDGVTALHQAGILHRDIKPGNVLVDEKGQAIVADFGLAWLHKHGPPQRSRLGTHAYAAPEQMHASEELTVAADIFSVGVSLYEVLTLELPYGAEGCNTDSLPAMPPSRFQRLLPSRDFDHVIQKAIAPNPAARYASMEELQEDWNLIRQGRSPRHVPHASWLGRAWSKHKARWIYGGLALAALPGIAALCAYLAQDLPGPITASEIKPMPSQGEQLVVTAAKLLGDYDRSPVQADQSYLGHTLRVTGTVGLIGKSAEGKMHLDLKDRRFATTNVIQCRFGFLSAMALSPVQPGDVVTVVGRCEGKQGTIILRDCRLLEGPTRTRANPTRMGG
jgi:serine/threonine protein kinase